MRNPAEIFHPRRARLGFHTTKTQGGRRAPFFAVLHNSSFNGYAKVHT
jgi:hypothetical protein